MIVWLWLVYKFTKNYCHLRLFSEFIQTQKRYPTFSWQNGYPNLKTTCHNQAKIFIVNLSHMFCLCRLAQAWKYHCAKNVRIWSFYGPYFPTFVPEKLQIRTLFRQCIIRAGVTRKKIPEKSIELEKNRNNSCYKITYLLKIWFLILVFSKARNRDKSKF